MKNLQQLLLLTALLLPILSVAQNGLFLDAGYQRSSLRADRSGIGGYSGYYLGLHYSETVVKGLEVSTSAQYSAKGINLLGDGQSLPFVDAQFTLGVKPVPEMSLFGGASVGRLLKSEGSVFIQRELDYGVLAGVKYDFDKVFLKMQYYRGLLDQRPSDVNAPAYITGIQVGLGFKIDFRPPPPLSDTLTVSTAPADIGVVDQPMEPAGDSMHLVKRRYEIGLKTTNLSNFEGIVKRKIGAARLLRFDVFASNLILRENTLQNDFNMRLGLTVGIEKRIQIDSKTHFSCGPQIGMLLDYNRADDETMWSPSIGYLLGVQYIVSDRIGIGVEMIPTLSYDRLDVWRLGFSSANVGLVVNYNFGSTSK